MAKSARASTRKRNNASLRTKVFGPAYDAREERLSAKLQELANAPKPEQEKKMDVDEDKKEADADVPAINEDQDEAMQWFGLAASSKKQKRAKSAGRLNKVAKRKPRNQMVFQSEIARKKRQAKGRKA
ncbi:hypothetical protein LTR70_003785 [Exophiala xenobiotica]|uniref:DUF2423 domain-containing protein n=1 Tax=Lithohypha guttulata TaxID=1690604 RepID=A0ABR0KFL1_9EURO|nr:hypothetical protein LTR24_003348 [Lithohypha guttulata]KAK5322284.1 hypothetical protein LTR70_003785 [Exophiala xenobiotica]